MRDQLPRVFWYWGRDVRRQNDRLLEIAWDRKPPEDRIPGQHAYLSYLEVSFSWPRLQWWAINDRSVLWTGRRYEVVGCAWNFFGTLVVRGRRRWLCQGSS